MGGGGSGGFLSRQSPEDYKAVINETREKTQDSRFETEVNCTLTEVLGEANKSELAIRDQHLEDIKNSIEENISGTIILRFGGSVSKHTNVDGLSDVDILMIIDKTELSNMSPNEVLSYVKNILIEKKINKVEEVHIGKLAVTVRFSDGMEIQILPAIKKGEGYKIANSKGDGWSNIIKPQKFAEKLTQVNQSCNSKVIPLIKLVKVINAKLPEDQQLTGYHVESLAIEVFKSYPESSEYPRTPKAMLKYFYEKAPGLIKEKIKDKTGQSIHVDDYLGPNNSEQRYRVSYTYDRIYRKMKNADEIKSIDEWKEIIGEYS